MIRTFLRERLSWLVFFAASQLLILLVAWLDRSVPLGSLLYIVLLSSLAFLAFLLWRASRETAFYRSLRDYDPAGDLAPGREPSSPFERIVWDAVALQDDRYRTEASARRMELTREKDELLSWVHEIKTPLTTLQLMIDRLDDESARPRLMAEWLRVHLLVDQQLHRKRLPFMHNDLAVATVPLEPLLNAEIQSLRSWCMQKHIGFDISLDEPEVLSDAKWLGFILRQILSNAVKYSSDSDITVESFRRSDGHVALRVQDQGRGISAKDLPRIFEQGFTSTAGSRHRDQASSGMGLYLAAQAAERLLITIEAESEPGAGSAFTLHFPQKNDLLRLTNR
ncbi:HAMP domain-containing histidine kinase [Paenibacillus spiritus]|uniref:histidine kinase n=1 Tax=Paenibacillus spiritus TaxID=2496557 RepID=A0A5J5G8T4_9BACL|nr:sensor histidine kinase [Paenibacillus spiritus]KAA9004022.1 HAMP domain-containing histidine kinase [Paenibacillus spiritus]